MANEYRIYVVVDPTGAQRGSQKAKESLNDVETAADKLTRSVRQLFTAFFALRAVQGITAIADEYTSMNNRLLTVTSSQKELNQTFNRLKDIAQETRVGLKGTVELFVRAKKATQDLGISQDELFKFTTTLNKGLVLSGATAKEANAALIQLSQGLASGVVRGDEFRSISEQLPFLLDILAKQLGVARSELKSMAAQGAITAKVFVDAVNAASGEIESGFAATTVTMGQAFVQLRNSFVDFVGKVNEGTGVFGLMAKTIAFVAHHFEAFGPILLALGQLIIVYFVGQALAALKAALVSIAAFAVLNPFTAIAIGGVIATGAVIGLANAINDTSDVGSTMTGSVVAWAESIQETDRVVRGFIASAEAAVARVEQSDTSLLRAAAAVGKATEAYSRMRKVLSDLDEKELKGINERIRDFKETLDPALKTQREFNEIQWDLVRALALTNLRYDEYTRLLSEADRLLLQGGKELDKQVKKTRDHQSELRRENEILAINNTLARERLELIYAAEDAGADTSGFSESGRETLRLIDEQLRLKQEAEARDKSTESLKKQRDAYKGILQSLEREVELLGYAEDQREKAKRGMDLYYSILDAGLNLDEKQISILEKLFDTREKLLKQDEERKRIADLTKEIDNLIGKLYPAQKALQDFYETKATLDKALKDGLIDQQLYIALLERQHDLLKDQIDPIKAIEDALVEEIEILRLSNKERERAIAWREIEKDLDKQGVILTAQRAAGLKLLLEAKLALQAADKAKAEEDKNFEKQLKLAHRGKDPQDVVSGLRAGLKEYRKEVLAIGKLTKETLVDAFHHVENAFVSFITTADYSMKGLEKTAAKLIQSLFEDITRLLLRMALAGIINGATGGGGGAAVGGGVLLANLAGKFAHGGSFDVAGSGGTDSQLVQFMATPGERVTVQTPQQQSQAMQSAPPAVNVRVVNVTDPNDTLDVLESPEAERRIFNVIRRNKTAMRSLLS